MATPIPAQVTFNEFGLPVSTAFDDIYFTNDNGLDESQYVFLQHNDLPERWQTHPGSRFVIAESGFGTGLNLLATWQLLLQHAPSSLQLHFISFEKYPLRPEDLARALRHFNALKPLADELLAVYPAAGPGCHRCLLADGRITLDLWFGDIHEQLPQWLPGAVNQVDAWFLDGFAPDKNPQMWQQNLYDAMARSAAPGSTFATFTAAGAVRRGLQQAGYSVSKVAGFGRKREMLRGYFPTGATSPGTAPAASDEPVLIIGGGIAAATMAHALTRRHRKVKVLTAGLADGASGNPQGAVYPLLHAELSPLSELFLSAFSYAQQFYQRYCPTAWHPCGVLQLAYNDERANRAARIAGGEQPLYSKATVRWLSPDQTRAYWHQLPACPALLYPDAGWLSPPTVVRQLLEGIDTECAAELERIEKLSGGRWQLHFSDGSRRQSGQVVLAMGAGLNTLIEPFGVSLQNVRGQVTQVASTAASESCPSVICYKGYFTPAADGQHCVGATYARQFSAAEAQQNRSQDEQENLANLQDNLQQDWTRGLTPTANRTSLRNTTRDHMPLAGFLDTGLLVFGGLGSRGFTSAPLLAELLAAELLASTGTAEPLPLGADLRRRLAPARLQPKPD
ncbi:bifunctional tRNA (5-methylaminomethyl-2-thiouridine)(34)-methyltransferase MnmD/FAD-dependent 5-carboxymethylaminomethyl-2-thiouridine(34) oxidoreductase MnmC [Pseudidiomarina sp.]|uniref:bifunctional tRNA (5-methylaminomethyl-2-thiouridine)(34)-methyltransferase MnmD/FAD-dependent 5-carboxymethylaminomethyl-2-thiouridine(34) oxidoreductase MnmC n=1 Tax=Pseudidiomarina sp. TaxID=2081707 RepID=UPI00299F1D23|nr:bifunctional tRNA (5-methylaminomethyl-2-thiouridine)(34)-methyltransferase MnmD/FAD-dependent 5-carboxymethylaminomethyl-2-thiouridine(34) oxidoreductase MnmC [Pseudidiomarina sp.]MDX1705856.1 bifunctional tRNA (5-methylaminomethyl-2-thiouridine)(34)-methyltransferase MnmD/FAD-dependent 5-carboxymethylaminomethyl-2-thiouridine(34) oxidoreductase MnmC [Pseudidiomarina sp.]